MNRFILSAALMLLGPLAAQADPEAQEQLRDALLAAPAEAPLLP